MKSQELVEFETVVKIQGLAAVQKAMKMGEMERVEFIWPHPYPGGWPIPIYKILRDEMLAQLTEGAIHVEIDGIRGGIRDPHLHLADRIMLLEREQFAKVVGNVAMELAGKFALEADYVKIMDTVRNLVPEVR